MLETHHLHYAYTEEDGDVLHDINVDFPAGSIFAILGESGSGKTTLLNCLARFLYAQRGDISLHGKPIQDIPEKEFRQKIGVVFQDLQLFPHLTVLENLVLAPETAHGMESREAHYMAAEMLERLNLPEIADQYPARISGGQAQRVAIARALMLKPEYLLLDEPTSALDVNTTGEFGQWLLDLQDATTFIVVTHDIPFAGDVASAGVLLQEGRVTEKGSMEAIIDRFHVHTYKEDTSGTLGENNSGG
ncbi:MAG: amino acid ABC transporter ATP-binding protein [Candidatus Sumerlaeia bacterium]